MIFRGGYRSTLPRNCIHEEDAVNARLVDIQTKDRRKAEYNSSRRIKHANFHNGDQVLGRNFSKTSKLQPLFCPERFMVMDSMANGKIILVQSSRTGRYFKRHPNDIKLYKVLFQMLLKIMALIPPMNS